MSADPQKGSASKGYVPLLIFIALGSVFAPPSIIILSVGMIPSIIARFANPERVRGTIASMVALNLAGVIPVLGFLWERGHTIDQALILLSDVYMLLMMYGGAGVAGFLLWGVPTIVQSFYEVQARQYIKRLEKRRSKMIEEWGGQIIEDVKIQPSAAKNKKPEK
ncbi:MAG: hypothetical protein JKY04_07905 [Sneathiella sp.]|nr:hypothetical protein [Sneathiella sp.]